MTAKRLTLLLALAAVAGAAMHALWPSSAGRSAADEGRAALYYQDSMHPWVKSERPSRCALCGCKLVPIYERKDDLGAAVGLVSLNSNGVTVLNVQTEEVRRRPLVLTMRFAGTLNADETRKTIVDAPAPGRIDDVAVESAGADVKRGQALATFYSPDLTFQTRRYIFRDRWPDRSAEMGANPFPEGSTSERAYAHPTPLKGRPEQDPFYNDLLAPISGTITARNVYDGQYVAESDLLFEIVDCSVLWFRFDVYERQLPWVHAGQTVEVTVPAAPGRTFPGIIEIVEPVLDETTRTVKARANVENPVVGPPESGRRDLRLGMYAEARVRTDMPETLTVPRSAVLFAGGGACVYVNENGGNYVRRRVSLGRQGDVDWEVVAGLSEGERVVVVGNVLIDAEAQFAFGASGEQPSSPESGAGAGGDADAASALEAAMPEPAAPVREEARATAAARSREPSARGAAREKMKEMMESRASMLGAAGTNAAAGKAAWQGREPALPPAATGANLRLPGFPTLQQESD